MKETGIIRRVDELGRIVLPMELRRNLGINVKDPIEISVEGNRIILRKDVSSCIFCGCEDEITEFKGQNICKNCFSHLSETESFEKIPYTDNSAHAEPIDVPTATA